MIELKKVLVAIGFDETSQAALNYARALTKAFGGQLHVMHVMENPFLRAMANDPRMVAEGVSRRLLDTLTEDDRQTLHAVAVLRTSDAPAEEIVRYANAEGIGLIVMGTHGRPGLAHLVMGSVAEKVVRTAACPVLTIRHPEREFVTEDAAETPATA
jgi:nucleotide-binding universal stress UspA family protein